MATTTFAPGTIVTKEWLNDVDALVYDVFESATTDALARTAIGLGTTDSPTFANVTLTTNVTAATETITGNLTNTQLTANKLVYADANKILQSSTVNFDFIGDQWICLKSSDETTTITTGVDKITLNGFPACTVLAVRAALVTASTSGLPTFDINEGGVSILSTKLTIDINELSSVTAATAAVISDSTIANDAKITIDIDVAGTGAKGWMIYMQCRWT